MRGCLTAQKGKAPTRGGTWKTEKGIHLLPHEANIDWAPILWQAPGDAMISKIKKGSALVEFSVYWGRQIINQISTMILNTEKL